MKRVIRVLQRDLDDPACSRTNPCDCPIARAVKRIVNNPKGVSVAGSIDFGPVYNRGPKLPGKLEQTIYTRKRAFSFTVDIPAKYLKRRRKAA